MPVSAPLRKLVRTRAHDRCEYCRIHQDDDPFFQFHVEHVIARQHGGQDAESNLALACHHCNLHKGPNLSGIDPETQAHEQLFNPRLQRWEEHFTMRDGLVVGITPIGRTTVRVLEMNVRGRLDLRAAASRPL
jgi:hypothetical protein